MTQSLYAALTGKEIRDIIRNKFDLELVKIPYLKLGNSFHRAELDFGFTMKAYPADVPVPEKEFTITVDSQTITSPEAIKQITKAEELDDQLKLIRNQIDHFEEILKVGEECLATIRLDHEKLEHIDGSVPDQTRIENNLAVPVIDIKGGKRVETTLPASFFVKQTTQEEIKQLTQETS